MAINVRFNFDKDFDDNIYRASNKTNSSLHPLYDAVRTKTDDIATKARGLVAGEAKTAEALVKDIKDSPWDSHYGGVGRHGWLVAKATSFALKSAGASIAPTMGYDGKEIYGRVLMNRRGSSSVEFGGTDPVAEIGKGTGEYVVHPPYGFLRRAAE